MLLFVFPYTGLVCADATLGDLTSKTIMEANGWKVNVGSSFNPTYAKCAGTSTWYGYSSGSTVGSVAASLKGTGRATLNFGNCFTSGKVIVYLNNKEISRANANQNAIEIVFNFSEGDVLRIDEEWDGVRGGIIKLNSFVVSCSGK